jgi:hypothetical protein
MGSEQNARALSQETKAPYSRSDHHHREAVTPPAMILERIYDVCKSA